MGATGAEVAYRVGSVTDTHVGLRIQYKGEATLQETRVTITLLTSTLLSCRPNLTDATAGRGGQRISIPIVLVAAPQIPGNVQTVIDASVGVAVASSVVAGVPSGLVQNGIANALSGMLRCTLFDPVDEVDLINNPPGWAVGREELQYQRGSLLFVLIVLLVGSASCLGVVCAFRAGGVGAADGGPWVGAIGAARMPSLLLVAVMMCAEVAIPSVSSILFFSGSDAVDYGLALVVLVPIAAYICLYAHRASIGMQVTITLYSKEAEKELSRTLLEDRLEQQESNGSDDAELVVGRAPKHAVLRRALTYLLEPTHGPRVTEGTIVEESGNSSQLGERWLRRNFYFVADKRWPAFGAIEAVIGSMTNILEGIPLSSRSQAVCVARPVGMCFLLVCLLVLLVWRHPHAVRLQQGSSVAATAMLVFANVLVIISILTVNETLDSAAGWVIGVTSLMVVVTGLLDAATTAFALIPMLRESLGVRGRSYASAVLRSVVPQPEHLLEDMLPPSPTPSERGDVEIETQSNTSTAHLSADAGDSTPPAVTEESRNADQSSSHPLSSPSYLRDLNFGEMVGIMRNLGDAAAHEKELAAQEAARQASLSADERRRLEDREIMESVWKDL